MEIAERLKLRQRIASLFDKLRPDRKRPPGSLLLTIGNRTLDLETSTVDEVYEAFLSESRPPH
jgi:hypothetical protein